MVLSRAASAPTHGAPVAPAWSGDDDPPVPPPRGADEAEAARRAAATVDQFAYAASHDLQEPLRMVRGYLSLLQQERGAAMDPSAQELVRFAMEGTDKLQQMLNDLLDVARVDAARAHQAVDAGAALEEALDALRLAVRESGARVTHDALPTVVADRAQLARLFQNLVGNAIKFRGGAPPEVHVSVRREADTWVFCVRDNGIGIDPKHVSALFLPFRRLHSADKYPGTGMGLAICKKIVEFHEGRIWAESRPGEGSTFCFTLPERR